MTTVVKRNRKYANVHIWINKNFRKTGICEHCHEIKKTEWSNKSGEYHQVRTDWQELCRKCHLIYDLQPHMKGKMYKVGGQRFLQLPINPGEELKAKEIKSKIGAYKALHDNRSLIEALAEMLEAGEKELNTVNPDRKEGGNR